MMIPEGKAVELTDFKRKRRPTSQINIEIEYNQRMLARHQARMVTVLEVRRQRAPFFQTLCNIIIPLKNIRLNETFAALASESGKEYRELRGKIDITTNRLNELYDAKILDDMLKRNDRFSLRLFSTFPPPTQHAPTKTDSPTNTDSPSP